jgi:hypothetical protein
MSNRTDRKVKSDLRLSPGGVGEACRLCKAVVRPGPADQRRRDRTRKRAWLTAGTVVVMERSAAVRFSSARPVPCGELTPGRAGSPTHDARRGGAKG